MNLLSVSWIFFQEMVDFWPRPIQFCCALWFPCGEGNGNPLQYSCLENSVGRGAYWAAVHGITQSRTWLKWLSSSSSSNVVPLGVAIGGNDPYLSHRVLHLSSPLLQFTRLNLMCVHVCAQSLNRVWLFATPWTIAHKATLSVGFPRQEYLNELPFPTPGHFPDWGIKPHLLYCLHWQEGSLPLYHGKLKPYGIVIQKEMKFKNSSMRCNLTCSFWEALVWERAT